MKLSRDEVQRIALLARLGLREDEIEKFRVQLSDILENFEILKQVDTANLSPTAQSINLQNIFRADEAKVSYPVEEILVNAPQQNSNYFKVKAVLEE
jgi:aspartyl-tRNA(Asn)/glutamyl-tRNA(Gln) amidotransferase subunit C